MTVKQLIATLKELPQVAQVVWQIRLHDLHEAGNGYELANYARGK